MDPRVIDLKEANLDDEQCEWRIHELLEERREMSKKHPMPPITCVWLTGNRLTRIPKAVLEMTELESLYVGKQAETIASRADEVEESLQ